MPASLRDVGKRAVAVVAVEVVVLADFDDAVVALGHEQQFVVLAKLLGHARHAALVVFQPVLDLFRRRHVVGHEIAVEIAVQVVVGERHHDAGAVEIEAELLRPALRTCRRRG